MTTRHLAFLFPLLALVAGGCSVEVIGGGGPGGVGSDVRLDAAWTINGGAATPGACATAGLEFIELHVYSDAAGADELAFYEGLCDEQGFITGFDLRASQYYYEWVGFDVDDIETFRSPALIALDARGGGTFLIDADFAYDTSPFEGTDIGVYGTFDVTGPLATLAARCDAAGIDWVEIVIIDGELEYTSDALWNECENGVIDTAVPILRGDAAFDYEFRAYDSQNNLVDFSATTPLDVASADVDGFVDVGHFDFEATGIFLRVNLSYQDGGAYESCYQAGATTTRFTWVLYDGDPALAGSTAIYEREAEDVCWDYVDIDDYPHGLLETKTPYYFDIYSTDDTGTSWAGTCQFELNSLGYNEIECSVPFG